MDYSNGLLMGDPSLTGLLGGNVPPMPDPSSMPGVQQTPGALPNVAAVAPSAPSPLPNPATPVPNPRRSLLAHVHDVLMSGLLSPVHGLERVGSAVGGAMNNAVTGNAPSGFENILTPDEIQKARPSLLNAMFGGAPGETGQQQYETNLETLLKNKLTSAQVIQQQRVMQGRQKLYQDIGMPANGDPSTDQAWVSQAISRMMAIGDYEGVKALSPFAEKMYQKPTRGFEPKLFKDPQGNFHYSTPDANVPIPTGWSPVQSTGAGAVSWFKMPDGTYRTFKAGDTPPTGATPVSTNNIEISQAGTAGRFDRTYAANAVKNFQTDIKPLATKAQALNEAYDVLSTVNNTKDPALKKTLYGPAISRFVQAVEQSSNLRFQLLQYYATHLDPSVAGHWNLLRDRLTQGTLPGYTLNSMLQAVSNMKDVTANEIESHRGQATKLNPDLDAVLPSTDSYFPRFKGVAPGLPVGGAPAPKTGGYSPLNPFAKAPKTGGYSPLNPFAKTRKQ